MRCPNCKRPIPETAKICAHCEMPVSAEPTREEMDAAKEFLDQLPPDALAELHQVFAGSESADDFANRILVGECPKCGSENTGDCEEDPEIDEMLVGRCYDCGQLWCTECRRALKAKDAICECWEDDEELIDEDDDDEEGED